MPMFDENAANLMKSIRDMLAASRQAQALPNNIITSNTAADNLPVALPAQTQPLKPLCKEDMAAVCRCLHPLRAKWNIIGTLLEIEKSSLDVVGVDNEDSDDRLVAMVAVWLRQIMPIPTWQALEDAVECLDLNKAREISKIMDIETTPGPARSDAWALSQNLTQGTQGID